MKIKLEKTNAFWAYIAGGAVAVILGILLLPAWASTDLFFSTWGGLSVNIMISGLILAYILLYLTKRIKRYVGTPAQIVAIVELVLMAVVAVVCAVSNFVEYDVSFGGPCQIFGIALWVRGASGVYTGYYCDSNIVRAAEEEKKAKKKNSGKAKGVEVEIDTEATPKGRVEDFTVWRLTLAIVIISIGTYLFVKPAFEAVHLQWVFSCAIILVGLFFAIFGIFLKPNKVKVNSKTPRPEDIEQQPSFEKPESTQELSGKSAPDQLDESKINIKLGNSSANAMTKTAAYDAISGENTSLPATKE